MFDNTRLRWRPKPNFKERLKSSLRKFNGRLRVLFTDKGSLPEMRIWSILLIKSDLKWCIHLSRSLCIFQLLGECHCWWIRECPRAHIAKFCGQLWLIRSVLRASTFSVLKLIEIVILWVYYTIPFGFSLFRHFGYHIFTFQIHIHISTFKLLRLAKDHRRGFITRNTHMVHIVN